MDNIKIPVGMMMDMAVNEVMGTIASIMENNHIPPDLMDYVVSAAHLKLKDMKESQYSELYNEAGQKAQEG